MKLISIPKNEYGNYRLDVIFDGYKWDPQYLDNNTIGRFVLVITEDEHIEIEKFTKELYKETVEAEEVLNRNQRLTKALRLPRKIRKELKSMGNYQAGQHIRLMRFDFHPIADGTWAVSEVNSDVPGGLSEATLMNDIAVRVLRENKYRFTSFGGVMVRLISQKVKQGGKIMFVHCTSYSDDRQVMQFIGDMLEKIGFDVIYAAADHLKFENNKAISILDGNEGEVDAIYRFTPLEWLIDMKPKRWQGYFDTITTSCNHPVAIFAQTKRFPFIWEAIEKLGVDLTYWTKLLPQTLEVKDSKGMEGFIYKPVYGRVGEYISIKESCSENEYKNIIKDVKKYPKKYIAQKKFDSKPLQTDEGESYHVCLGAFCAEGQAAGYYARLSKTPRIDSRAADIPVLIEKKHEDTHKSINKMPARSRGNDEQMLGREINNVWAAAGAKWVEWVRPVPFIAINDRHRASLVASFMTPTIEYVDKAKEDTAVILDLPDCESIIEGVALAMLGFRPIPLFNGTDEQEDAMALLDNNNIKAALYWGAAELKKLKISPDAPPAFLLDSNRLHRHRMSVSVFDNSWDLYSQDMPTAEYFLSNGVKNIIVKGEKLQKDLAKILHDFQKKGLTIYFTDGYKDAVRVTLRKPRRKD